MAEMARAVGQSSDAMVEAAMKKTIQSLGDELAALLEEGVGISSACLLKMKIHAAVANNQEVDLRGFASHRPHRARRARADACAGTRISDRLHPCRHARASGSRSG
jgi:hypothetical protein